MIRESCPYCGEMTEMILEKGVWKSTACMHCKKDLKKLADSLPHAVEEKPNLKADLEDLP